MVESAQAGTLVDLTVHQMLAALSSAEPAPGGGSASALAGAMAASLVIMVTGLTVGRARYTEVDERMRSIAIRAAQLRSELTHLVDEDSAAYEAVIAALRMPKDTEAARASRHSAIQDATIRAAHIPLRTSAACLQVLGLAELVIQHGNPNALSDGAVAALLADAALRGAIRNVRINLSGLDAGAQVEELARRAANDEASANVSLRSALSSADKREQR
jgi:methenyltetrahydrofolate cyclohydrolase